MNWQRGLERISVVGWGLLAFAFTAVAIEFMNGRKFSAALGMLGMAVVSYGAHRVTCWIIGGFFAPKGW